MKQTDDVVRLWRVDLVHRNGYQAPSQLVVAKNRSEVRMEIKNLHLRLLDFPKSWSYYMTPIASEYDAKRGKWTDVKHNKPRRERRKHVPKKA